MQPKTETAFDVDDSLVGVRRESVKSECWVQGVYTKITDSNLVFLHQ
ncbi:MAG: hypothetical protein H7839_18210 [Magnetococcus sp. YQC-5]